MRHASLFTGIGGFDLAAEWMGWENIFQCEIDPWCQKLLKQNFPTVQHRYGNIKETDFKQWAGEVDVLTGGFPCQPYSTAGKRLGKDDERHLWPEYLRAIREIRPTWVVGENVRGLTNWNGGVVFDEVQADLEAEGYEVLPFLLPAAGVNAPHRRDRIWIIAHAGCLSGNWRQSEQSRQGINHGKNDRREEATNFTERLHKARIAFNPIGDGHGTPYELGQDRRQANKNDGKAQGKYRERIWSDLGRIDAAGATPDTYSDQRPERGLYADGPGAATRYTSTCGAWASGRTWEDFPTQPPVCGRNDGVSRRVDRLKGLGNAVVPQVVLQIFKAIEQHELLRIPS